MTELNANKQQAFIIYATKSWIKKGLMLHYLDRYEEALQAYDKALELNPMISIPGSKTTLHFNKRNGTFLEV